MIEKEYKELLRDDLDFFTAEKIQLKYSHELARMSLISDSLREKDYNIIVGVDVHYSKEQQREMGVACATFWDFNKKKVIETHFAKMKIKIPYKPGFLGFREAKVITHAIRESKIKADLLMCDGHGIIHPRNFGEAVHLGLVLDIPSIGIAKNPFIGFAVWKSLERVKGAKTPIFLRNPKSNSLNNKILGYAICLADSKKPVFLSIGYKISIEKAISIALETTYDHRQPEPVILADKYARKFMRK
jgi:deoxyribonuclease V